MRISRAMAAHDITHTPEQQQEVITALCEYIEGQGSLRSFSAIKGNPPAGTIMGWIKVNTSFAEQYALARESQADAFADELIQIADDKSIPADQKKHMLDARKWVAAKLKPRVYGDRIDISGKIDHEHSVTSLFNLIVPQPSLLCHDAEIIEPETSTLEHKSSALDS